MAKPSPLRIEQLLARFERLKEGGLSDPDIRTQFNRLYASYRDKPIPGESKGLYEGERVPDFERLLGFVADDGATYGDDDAAERLVEKYPEALVTDATRQDFPQLVSRQTEQFLKAGGDEFLNDYWAGVAGTFLGTLYYAEDFAPAMFFWSDPFEAKDNLRTYIRGVLNSKSDPSLFKVITTFRVGASSGIPLHEKTRWPAGLKYEDLAQRLFEHVGLGKKQNTASYHRDVIRLKLWYALAWKLAGFRWHVANLAGIAHPCDTDRWDDIVAYVRQTYVEVWRHYRVAGKEVAHGKPHHGLER